MDTQTSIMLAMLHFLQRTPTPRSTLVWWVWPEGTYLRHSAFCELLARVQKPAFISAHVEQGGVTVQSLSTVGAAAYAHLHQQWRNQALYLSEKLAALSTEAQSTPLLLELDDATLLVTTEDFAAWCEQYLITSIGWTIESTHGDSRAPLRLLLRHPDGLWSPGAACSVSPL